jgi:hypothetical protein
MDFWSFVWNKAEPNQNCVSVCWMKWRWTNGFWWVHINVQTHLHVEGLNMATTIEISTPYDPIPVLCWVPKAHVAWKCVYIYMIYIYTYMKPIHLQPPEKIDKVLNYHYVSRIVLLHFKRFAGNQRMGINEALILLNHQNMWICLKLVIL